MKGSKNKYMTPIKDHVLIRRAKGVEKIGSFYLPERAVKEEYDGEVLAVGPGVTEVSPGDWVFWGQFSGMNVDLEQEQGLVMMGESQILGVIEED